MTLKGSEYTQNNRACVLRKQNQAFFKLVRAPLFMELTVDQKMYNSLLILGNLLMSQMVQGCFHQG
jgi:hypothetical protein